MMTTNVCPLKGEALARDVDINHIKTELLLVKPDGENQSVADQIQSMFEIHNGVEMKFKPVVLFWGSS